MRMLTCGADALLVEVATLDQVEWLYGRLCQDRPRGVVEVVPAARTVLVGLDRRRTDPARLRGEIASLLDSPAPPGTSGPPAAATRAPAPAPAPAPNVTVPVRYDGPDLAEVATLAGMTPAEVIQRHLRSPHRVAFCGFAPGFAYITGLDPALRLPRRATPRTRVPPGSVAIADEFTGVYPRSSPGGWHLIGRTDLVVFDLDRDPAALLTPGSAVSFVEADPARARR